MNFAPSASPCPLPPDEEATAVERNPRSARGSIRQGLVAGVAVLSALGAVGPAAAAWAWGGGSTCANSGCTTAYAVPLPIPQTLSPTSTDATTDYYTLTEKPASLSSGVRQSGVPVAR